MRKMVVCTFLILGTLPCTSTLAGDVPGSGIIGSVHDMTKYFKQPEIEKLKGNVSVCDFCHPSHYSRYRKLKLRPLWGPKVIESLNLIYSDKDPIKSCEGCHDGVIASMMTEPHPTGSVYGCSDCRDVFAPSVITGDGNGPAKGLTYLGSTLTIAERLTPSAKNEGKFIMTCTSCHDVHNRFNKDSTSGKNYLLLSPSKSMLCHSCHQSPSVDQPKNTYKSSYDKLSRHSPVNY